MMVREEYFLRLFVSLSLRLFVSLSLRLFVSSSLRPLLPLCPALYYVFDKL